MQRQTLLLNWFILSLIQPTRVQDVPPADREESQEQRPVSIVLDDFKKFGFFPLCPFRGCSILGAICYFVFIVKN